MVAPVAASPSKRHSSFFWTPCPVLAYIIFAARIVVASGGRDVTSGRVFIVAFIQSIAGVQVKGVNVCSNVTK